MDFAPLLQCFKQLSLNDQEHKGMKATDKPDRAFLEILFAKKAKPSLEECLDVCSIISYAYPPSVIPLAHLQPMFISDLRLETHHHGRALYLKTFGHPKCVQAVRNAVEDLKGDVDRLVVYNTHPTSPAERILCTRLLWCVSHLLHLQLGDERIPAVLRPRVVRSYEEAIVLKAEGNAVYGRKAFVEAVEYYSEALQASCTEGKESLRYDLYRNRASANLLLGRFEGALADADAAIIPSAPDSGVLKEATAKLNGKAYYRAGRAAYALRNFPRAAEYFRKGEQCSPSGDADAKQEVKRAAYRLEEQRTGRYDFAAMSEAVSATRNNRLDHADFTTRVEVRDAGIHGRGLFAVEALKMGDLVLCEKAFGVVFASEKIKALDMTVNLNTNRLSLATRSTLRLNLLQKLSHNPDQARAYSNLYDGGYTPRTPPQLVDGLTVVDTFRAAAILEYNVFICPSERSSDQAPGKNNNEDGSGTDLGGSIGVWLLASYINHACNGNATRAFIGDMMIIRAVRDIGAGEEVLMPYINQWNDQPATLAQLKVEWGFECDCKFCEADANTTKAQLERRKAPSEVASRFLSPQPLPNAANIRKAEKMLTELKATYDYVGSARNRPDLALTGLGTWLCQAHISASSPRKVIACANRLLGDLGYGVSIANNTVVIDHASGCPGTSAVDAAMYAAHAHYSLGERKLGGHYEMFAERLYVVMLGEKRGFAERYECLELLRA
ncbi:hypothetical protein LTR03_006182 [Friedmanniomyces endolithicus]|nr:hypothetical protein LTR03_006182 [Friedmanniomyces endolithicus]